MPDIVDNEDVRCSLCKKTSEEVRPGVLIITLSPEIYICNECVEVCNEMLLDGEDFRCARHSSFVAQSCRD